MAAAAAEETLVEDIPGFLQVYGDGFISRFDYRVQPPSPDMPVRGVLTRDITIPIPTAVADAIPQEQKQQQQNKNTNNKKEDKEEEKDEPLRLLRARLFLPYPAPKQRRPLVLYFHGGGFCVGSTTWGCYHTFLSDVAATLEAVVLSVDYRLAPEHRLPAAYDDALAVLTWATTASDPWLRDHAQASLCVLAGESAGANIAYAVATRAPPALVASVVLLHPFFGGEQRLPREAEVQTADDKAALEYSDTFWRLALPPGADRQHPACNPCVVSPAEIGGVALPPVLVVVSPQDLLMPRGVLFYEHLRSCGKAAQLHVEEEDDDGEVGHVHFLFNPVSHAYERLLRRITAFVSASASASAAAAPPRSALLLN